MALTSSDLQAIAGLLDPIHSRLGKMEGRLDKLESQVSALTGGQIKNELYKSLVLIPSRIL